MSMFRRRGLEPDEKAEVSAPSQLPQLPRQEARPQAAPPERREPKRVSEPSAATVSRIGKSVKFQGEIHSQEDLFIDGIIEGAISIPDHLLVIGPNSQVQADIDARSLELHGLLRGKVIVGERIQIKKKGCLEGSLVARRLVIEDGAVFCGTSEVKPAEPDVAPAPAAAPQRTAAPKAADSRPATSAPAPAGVGKA